MQFIKIYLRNCYIYNSDLQDIYKAIYIIKNFKTSQKYKKYNKNNIR